MYIRTHLHWSKQPTRVVRMGVALALFAILATGAASAQNRQTDGQSAQGVLHIRVRVVPTVMLPRVQAQAQQGTVSYDMPTRQISTEVIEKISVLPRRAVGGGGAGMVVLHTLTVVPK